MRKILVVTDPEFSNEIVLNRIREVPKEDTQFFIEHYLTATHAKNGSALVQEIQAKKDWLNNLVAPLIDDGFNIETSVQSYTRLFETIISSAQKHGVDYVFKPLRHHGTLQRLMYTSTDWNLVRFCPCPLLLVSDKDKVHSKPVLATLDLGTRDQPHKELNNIVLDRSKALAGLIDGSVHLVNAYNMVTVAGADASLDTLKHELVQGARSAYFETAKAIAEENDIEIDCIHLEEGAAEAVVNTRADAIGAGIIVVGTLARSGMSGLFLGNTAEAVIERANCDVFVVKNKDFVSPIEP